MKEAKLYNFKEQTNSKGIITECAICSQFLCKQVVLKENLLGIKKFLNNLYISLIISETCAEKQKCMWKEYEKLFP